MGVELRWGSATDTGRVRDLNEDSLLVTDRLFAVADGMGGHAAGEVASLIAVETLRAADGDSREAVVDAVRQANAAVFARSESDAATRGMGTTLSVVALIGDEAIVVANVGDSRVYRLQQGELEQLSEDHSLVQDLVREGRISAAEARVHPNRNVVTRTIGNDPAVEVDWWEIDPVAGDRYLICSDGLTDEIEDHAIARVLHTVRDPDEAASTLVDLANHAGGRDNITVVIVDVVDDGGRSAAASKALGKDAARRSSSALVRESAGGSRPSAGDERAQVDDAPRRLTWRTTAFVAAVVLVLVAAAGGTAWFARNAYFVGVDDDTELITIYRGRPGGVLWVQPTVEQQTDLRLDDVLPSRRDEIAAGHEVDSVARAERYLRNITTTTTTTTTTTSTTTTSTTTTTAPPP